MIERMLRTACAVLVLSVLASSAWAQVRIDIQHGSTRTPIAVPVFGADPGEETLAAELTEVVRYDLDFTGMFNLLPSSSYPSSFTGFTRDVSQMDFAGWRAANVEYLVYVYLSRQGNQIIAECRLFDVLGGQQVVGKRFDAEHDYRRLVVHRFSDEIVLFLSGKPGIATSQICFSGGTTGSKEIYVVDYDGANLRKVTNHAATSSKPISILPKFSPDGNRIAYLSYMERYPFLYIIDLATGASKPLSDSVGLNVSPAWSPDGSRLAVVLSKDANTEIYMVNPDGSGAQRITNDRSVDTSPAFSPEGHEMVFVSDRQGQPQIFAMSTDGSAVRRLSHQGGSSYDPEWSPDGKGITYVVEKGGHQVFIMDADGRNPRQVTTTRNNESPSWSPDSRYIVFSSSRRGATELWTVNVETGEERPVPNLSLSCQGPSWGPRRH